MTSAGASDTTSGETWFISHAGADRAWAEWVAWQLTEAGHEVELDYWDWGAGDNFILKMNAALERGRMLVLFSPAYFELERFTTPEWTAVLARKEKIVPVRIAEVTPPAILGSVLAPDLFGLDDHDAREALLRAVAGPARPSVAPPRPQGMRTRAGEKGPRLPGSLPTVAEGLATARASRLSSTDLVNNAGTPAPPSWEFRLREAARVLARHAQQQGEEQELRRGLCSPPPIQLRFTAAPADLVAQGANIRGVRLGTAVPEPLHLHGRLDDIEDVYLRVGGRLVILGERGSGKSVVAQRLALMLLASRTADDEPVPIIFRLHNWNPGIPLKEWLAAFLADNYNGLGATGPSGTRLAEALIDEGYILPILDGFDEISAGLHKSALLQLNETLMPLVLTSTTDAYARTVCGDRTLARAAVVVLEPVAPDDLLLYLPRTAQTDPAATHWASVLGSAAEDSGGLEHTPVGRALSTPLMVGLARSVYSEGPQDPTDLLDRARFPSPSAVEDHLLDQFVPAVYERRSPWRVQDAQRWLGHLARQPDRSGIAWWELANAVPRGQRSVAFALPSLLLGAITGYLNFGWAPGTAGVAGVVLLLGAVTGWFRSPAPARMALRASGRVRHVLTQVAIGPIGGAMVALMGHPMVRHWGWLTLTVAGGAAGALGGVLTGWGRRMDPEAENRSMVHEGGKGLRGGTAGGFAVGCFSMLAGLSAPTGSFRTWLVLGVGIGLAFALESAVLVPTPLDTVVTPRLLLRSNRQYALFMMSAGGASYGLVAGILMGPVAGLVGGAAVGVAVGIGRYAWGRWLIIVRFWMPLRGQLPWRIWAFLDDAHERGVLRQAGAAYVFRHRRIQESLAAE
ncbi:MULTISPECIES: TIR domain-containing protein [unclassified Streptomyces]|uniref:TIR domain-containing protein n=1 Tax=unclassified Streptomyces TaxID=2593676 RepID=UPI0036E07EAC